MAQNDSTYYLNPTHLKISNGELLEEAAPLLSIDKKRIYFTVADKEELDKNGKLRHEIWYADFEQGQLNEAIKAQKPLNIGLNSGVIGMNNKGNRLYLFGAFNKLFENQETISYTDLVNGKWQKPISLDIPGLKIDGGFYGFYMHPYEKIIIISQAHNGQEDLYISEFDESTGQWSIPQALNDMINTEDYEISPFMSQDLQYLYFSRGNNSTDADIFVSKRCGTSLLDWAKPERLPSPINSDTFDAYFSIGEDSTITFSSNRNGSADIFISKLMMNERLEIPNATTIEKDLLTPAKETRTPTFRYSFNAESTNYVFFAFNSSRVNGDFKRLLISVAEAMLQDDKLIIEIAGHTDYIDEKECNTGLSDRRALAVSNILVSMGIDKERIFPVGYGESLPISNNRSTKGRALNRRVELILIRKEVAPN